MAARASPTSERDAQGAGAASQSDAASARPPPTGTRRVLSWRAPLRRRRLRVAHTHTIGRGDAWTVPRRRRSDALQRSPFTVFILSLLIRRTGAGPRVPSRPRRGRLQRAPGGFSPGGRRSVGAGCASRTPKRSGVVCVERPPASTERRPPSEPKPSGRRAQGLGGPSAGSGLRRPYHETKRPEGFVIEPTPAGRKQRADGGRWIRRPCRLRGGRTRRGRSRDRIDRGRSGGC
jgi:hypothetical protein